MHKHLFNGVVALVIISGAFFAVSKTAALDSSSWVTSAISAQKQADTTTMPLTISGNGNIDCAPEDPNNCSVGTNYGTATPNSSVRFNSSGSFVPVITYMDGRQHFFPVPNSDVAISSYNGGAVYGLNLAFNYSFISSIIKTGRTYTITRPPDGKLADKTKRLLPADTASVSFSENGRWMLVSIPNTAIARVDLQTFDVLPFSPGFNYTIGLDPSVKTAITNDGRYAVVASNNFNTFKIYDLNTCAATPDVIIGPVTCQSRDLRSFMQGVVPGFSFVANARFMDDSNLAVYAVYKSGTANETARFIISDSGIAYHHDLLALGDSYISGEGAFDYMGSTDTATNKCHLSLLSYPFLIGKSLNYNSYHSVACSGAGTKDITDTKDSYAGQTIDKTKRSELTQSQIDSIAASFLPGYIDQLEFVKTYQPQTVTLSIGGNDTGFANIVRDCAQSIGTCYEAYEDRLELVRQINTVVYPRLVQTYQQIKAAGPPDMRIYVIGYPQIAKPGGDCGLNVHLNADEILFAQELTSYLDTVVQDATVKAGVYYVDAQDALNGFRLCEAGPGAVAVNGLTAGNDIPARLGGPIGKESYHPNTTGYQLLENKILALTHNLSAPMPTPNTNISLPLESSLELLEVDYSGRTVNTATYDPGITVNLAYQQTPIDISVNGSEDGLTANTTVKAELHSTPLSLGSYQTDINGNLSAKITIPAAAATGYHTLHFYGTNIAGQSIDIYKYIYVVKSADDLDGNGILDNTQKCVGVDPSGQDFDNDGIDDACDANITQPPDSSSFQSSNDNQDTIHASDDNSSTLNISSQVALTTSPVSLLANSINITKVDSNLPSGIGNLGPFSTDSLQFPSPATAVLNMREHNSTTSFQNEAVQSNFNRPRFIVGISVLLVGIFGLLKWRKG